jgi:Na+/H+ antiporter NhaD/arsenite permease-like protein
MLLIRPVLQINSERKNTRHLPVFFIFIVCNLGGLLTPLGDPPLFLGFLNGVDFFWTLRLWPQWCVVNGLALLVFWCWDSYAYRHESAAALAEDRGHIEPLRLKGKLNFLLLAGIVAAALLQSERFSVPVENGLRLLVPLPANALASPFGEGLMALMALLSWWLTPKQLREANGFGWGAILEVAILFAGIFITMVPALALLTVHGKTLGVTQPWEYFWLTGGLSSFLDNAPTYVTFATLAAGSSDFSLLMAPQGAVPNGPKILEAISCGAVFMGANTYIGNGPNFMVKAIADQAGYPTPSFFGYMAYSGAVLLPVFGLVMLLFFRPG